MSKEIVVADEPAMEAFGAELSALTGSRCVIFLSGELGAGKTTLVRGFMRALGHKGAVKSPTYTLVEPYVLSGKKVYHFDLYRVVDPEELELIGIRDYFQEEAVFLIEWPERALELLPQPDITCDLQVVDAGRVIELTDFRS